MVRRWLQLPIVLLLALGLAGVAQGQTAPTRHYSAGRVIKKDRTRLQVQKLVFTRDSLAFVDKQTQQPITLPLTEVQQVRANSGNNMLLGAALIGGSALLGALAGLAQVESDPNLEVKDNAAGVVIGVTAGGVVLGGILGAMVPRQKTVYQNGRYLVLSPVLELPARHERGVRVGLALRR